MRHKSSDEYLKAVQVAFEEERYEDALQNAVMGYTRSVDEKLDARGHTFLRILRSIVLALETSSTSSGEKGRPTEPSCSFCGRPSSETKILVGASGAICSDCAKRAISFFSAH